MNSNLIVFFSYMLLVLGIGFAARSRNKSFGEFFLGSRKMGWFPVGISVMITAFSAIQFKAFTEEIASGDLAVLAAIPAFFLIIPVLNRYLIPFFRQQQIDSAYELLENRFSRSVRVLASLVFIFWQVLWMGAALMVMALVSSPFLGISHDTIILIAALVVVIYTSAGGVKAVIWTDVLQFFVLFGALLVCIWIAWTAADSAVLPRLLENEKFSPFFPADAKFWSFDPRLPMTFWSVLIGSCVIFLARFGASHLIVQRYLAAKDQRSVQNGIFLNAVAFAVVLLLLAALGLALSLSGEKVALGFFLKQLPTPWAGLLLAGLAAATMSSLDSGINSCAASVVSDVFGVSTNKRKFCGGSLFFVIISALLGVLAVITAFVFLRIDRSVFRIIMTIVNAFGSPLLAVMLLAVLPRRPSARSVFVGLIGGAIFSIFLPMLVEKFSFKLALHYYAVLNLLVSFFVIFSFYFIEKCFSSRKV